jgi:predicted ATP-grasp superfamily ATP-dependent carboligase
VVPVRLAHSSVCVGALEWTNDGLNGKRVGIPVLLAATATKWAGPARLPRELVQAGFDVAVLAPKGALVAESRYVASVSNLPETATPMQWLYMLAASVDRWAPRLIVPCDDTTLQLMISFVEDRPEGLKGPLRERLVALIHESLGEPRHYRTSIDKTLLPPAAEALGVRVPAYAVVAEVAAARAFAQAHGYPVVLKRAFGTAGEAVEVVPEEARLESAFRKLMSAGWTSLWNSLNLLVQAWIPGKGLLHAVAAWGGVAYAGMTREVLMRSSATGPSTVVRCRHAPEAQRFSELLSAGFGINGFFGAEFIEHERTGDVYLIEINRRVTNGVQLGGFVGVDLCGALAAALSGRTNANRTSLPAGEEHLIAEFPQEWLRDPASSYLHDARTDVPWDDLRLLRAMLAMRQTA